MTIRSNRQDYRGESSNKKQNLVIIAMVAQPCSCLNNSQVSDTMSHQTIESLRF